VYCIVQEKIKLNLLIASVNNNIKIKVLSIMAGIKKNIYFNLISFMSTELLFMAFFVDEQWFGEFQPTHGSTCQDLRSVFYQSIKELEISLS
jgi:hypothetical protein